MTCKNKILYLVDVHTDPELVKNEIEQSNINFDLLTVDSEIEFVKELDDYSPDIVLCDYSLSGFNSYEAIRIIKEKKLNTPFIIITAIMTDDLAMHIVRGVADDYIMIDRLQRLPYAIINAIKKYNSEKDLKRFIDKAYEKLTVSDELLHKLSSKAVDQSLFETIIHSSNDAIISKTLDSIITSWNHGAERMFGYTAKEAIGENISIIIPSDLVDDEKNIVAAAKGGKYIKQYETERLTKDGVRLDVSLTISPLLDWNGNIIGVSKIAMDITSRKRAQQQMKDLTNRLLMATNSANMGIWDWDIEKDYLQWDEGMRRIYQINSLEFGSVYDSWLSRLHPEDRQRTNEELQQTVRGENVYDTEFRIIGDNLSVRYVRATGLIERNNAGNAIRMIGLNWDVTERRLAEMRLLELNENIEIHVKKLAESNAELEQFAYVASHDLQEPLRMVTSYLTQLEKKYGDIIDAKGKQYIYFAVDGAKRMRQIILDLLEFSRVGKSDESIEGIDLSELVHDIELLYIKQIEDKQATIVFDDPPRVHFHRAPLRQVFQNLISNALKYARENIPVRIHITAEEFEDHWQFGVADDGIGIEKEYFDKIFVIFQRLHNKNEFSGTGIGLAITKKIIENMGGKIWVESTEGVGSCFFFTLLKQQ